MIGLGGLALAIAYPLVVREKRIATIAGPGTRAPDARKRTPLRALFANRSVRLAYLASGIQLFAAGALPAWLPSYFNRYYAMPVDAAGRTAAIFLLICGCGMVLCGIASDRAAQGRPWIFREIAHFLATGTHLAPPTLAEARALILEHLADHHAFYGEAMGVRIARKHLGWYTRGCAGAERFRAMMNAAETAPAQVDAVERYLDVLAAQGEWFVATGEAAAPSAFARSTPTPRAVVRGGEALAA